MFLTAETQQVVETVVYEIVPPEYQQFAIWIVGLAFGSIILYNTILKPLIDKWSANKTTEAINENALTEEQVQQSVTSALETYKKAIAMKELEQWKYKLLFATTEEAKAMCNEQIAILTAEINSYA